MSSYMCVTQPVPRCCLQHFNTAAEKHYALQQTVLASLPENQDILHVKSLTDWQNILRTPQNTMITVEQGGVLVAQSMVISPDTVAPDADMLDMPLPDRPERLTTLCAVMVDPVHRNRHLMQHMMAEWKAMATVNNRPHLLGCITRTNWPSWSQFLKAGLVITGGGLDPSDNSTVYYAHRNMHTPIAYTIHDTITVSADCPMRNLQRAFDAGYVGVQGEKQNGGYTGRLIMAKRLG